MAGMDRFFGDFRRFSMVRPRNLVVIVPFGADLAMRRLNLEAQK